MEPELRFYNTLSRKKDVFKPLKPDFVRVYDCGPTVYWYAHIGNMWRFIISDLVRRVLEYNGYKVRQVMNITDVGHLSEEDLAADTGEDKIEVAARREKKTPQEIAEFYTQAFLKDLDRLNIQRPQVMPRATEHIDEMIGLIRRLEEKGYTYRAGNYLCFDISKFKDYGKLSGKDLDRLQAGARLEPVPGKKNPFDFALWIVDDKHLQKWDSPWGVGYPGWHIECSAMSMKYLGEQLDIHSGGEDNIFPHHENEIAQSEAATGKQFVRFWLHVRFLQVEGEKMSKSKGNLFRIDDLIARGFDPLAFRYLCLTAHYRHPLNFTWEGLRAAQNALRHLRREAGSWRQGAGGGKEESFPSETGNSKLKTSRVPGIQRASEYRERFLASINDDLNVPQALSVVWDLVRFARADPKLSPLAFDLISDFDEVLGLGLASVPMETIPQVIKQLAAERERFRKIGQYDEADRLRREILDQGYTVEDTPQGPRIKKA